MLNFGSDGKRFVFVAPFMVLLRGHWINHFWGNQTLQMLGVILKDFPWKFVHCLGWQYNDPCCLLRVSNTCFSVLAGYWDTQSKCVQSSPWWYEQNCTGWLNGDPFIMTYEIITKYNWVVCHPQKSTINYQSQVLVAQFTKKVIFGGNMWGDLVSKGFWDSPKKTKFTGSEKVHLEPHGPAGKTKIIRVNLRKKHTWIFQIPSRSLTWNLKMVPWNRRFLLETIIFSFHVKLGECM